MMEWFILASALLCIGLSAAYGILMVWEIYRQHRRMTYTSIWHDDKERIL